MFVHYVSKDIFLTLYLILVYLSAVNQFVEMEFFLQVGLKSVTMETQLMVTDAATSAKNKLCTVVKQQPTDRLHLNLVTAIMVDKLHYLPNL